MSVKKLSSRFVSFLLCLALLVTLCPAVLSPIEAKADVVHLAADTPLADASGSFASWRELFPVTEPLTTENAGGVWTNKTVFTKKSAQADTVLQGIKVSADAGAASANLAPSEADNFLVALSAIGSNMTVTGQSSQPTDTILVLDVSGSMNDGNNDVVEELVNATNSSLTTLLNANPNNRVGVVLYSATDSNSSASVLLPLDRYTTGTAGEYLTYEVETSGNNRPGPGGGNNPNNTDETIGILNSVLNSSKESVTGSREVVGGTYIQAGIAAARDELKTGSATKDVPDAVYGTVSRIPVIVLMSDGEPTHGSTNFTDPSNDTDGNGSFGNGQGSANNDWAQPANRYIDFVFTTQLTAAYVKQEIKAAYGAKDCLFYTLGYNISSSQYATSTLDPENSLQAVDDLWVLYNSAEAGGSVSLHENRTVTKVSETLEQVYATEYYSADNVEEFLAAFQSIMTDIALQSAYKPTLITGTNGGDLSGYVSFVDRIGDYMEVKDVKGIIVSDVLYTGALLSRNFVSGGGDLGTFESSTALGDELVHAVQQRLGIATVEEARQLLGRAYNAGQLSYTSDTEFSNYIGYYADSSGDYCGFYDEATMAGDTPPANAIYTVKSYGYLGVIDKSHAGEESDMMYANVEVRTYLDGSGQVVAFAIPANLLPLVTYQVSLDEDGNASALSVANPNVTPFGLVYEVGLWDNINSYNVKSIVDKDYYTDENGDPDPDYIDTATGAIKFYSNTWMDIKGNVGSGNYNTFTNNTYAYFNPSVQNERYYFLTDTPIYSAESASALCNDPSAQPSTAGTYYFADTVYSKNGTVSAETVYLEISDEIIGGTNTIVYSNELGAWVVPAGTVHVNLHQSYDLPKGTNSTGTMPYALYPVVDTSRHPTIGDGTGYFVAQMLGNNGLLALEAETGISITKTMAAGSTADGDTFTFTIEKGTVNGNDFTVDTDYEPESITYAIIDADGVVTGADENVLTFTDGAATIALKAGQTVLIGELEPGLTFRVTETRTEAYILTDVTVEGTGNRVIDSTAILTTAANEFAAAGFTNAERGVSDFTVSKIVEHPFGLDYAVTKDFTMVVTLELLGQPIKGATYTVEGDTTETTVSTDDAGQFTITLKDKQQITVHGIPEGTVVTVVENAPGAGFADPVYTSSEGTGNSAVIDMDENDYVQVTNTYDPAQVQSPVPMIINASKIFMKEADDGTLTTVTDAANWQVDATVDPTNYYAFDVVLEWDEDGDGVFTQIGETKKLTYSVDNAGKPKVEFDFSELTSVSFTEPGEYAFQLREVENEDYNHMFYDPTWYIFTVVVGDETMDGYLEITNVHCNLPHDGECTHLTFTTSEGTNGIWTYSGEFTNVLYNVAPALATVDFQKVIVDGAGNAYTDLTDYDVNLEYYTIDIYTDPACEAQHLLSANIDNYPGIKSVNSYPSDAAGQGWIDIVFEHAEDENGNCIYPAADATTDPATPAGKTYTFYVKETAKTTAGMTYSTEIYEVTFVVDHEEVDDASTTDVNERELSDLEVVEATYRKQQPDGSFADFNYDANNSISIENVYDPGTASITPFLYKELTGRDLNAGDFTFTIYSDAELQNRVGSKTNAAAAMDPETKVARDKVTFDPLTFTKAGTYYYWIVEQTKADGTNGITYDHSVYHVTVTVEDQGGVLVADYELTDFQGGDIIFRNTYSAEPYTLRLGGTKTLQGRDLIADEFFFTISRSDEKGNVLMQKDEAGNDVPLESYTVPNLTPDGQSAKYVSPDLTVTEVGTYYYVITEEKTVAASQGVTLDKTKYLIEVKIVDDGNGKLTWDQNGEYTFVIGDDGSITPAATDSPDFTNVYAPGAITVDISASKQITGRSLRGGDYTFELYTANVNGEEWPAGPAGEAYKTATNAADGTVTFENIQIPGTPGSRSLYYFIKESIPEDAEAVYETIDDEEVLVGYYKNGTTYDPSVYRVKLDIVDDGRGTLSLAATHYYDNEGVPVSGAAFANDYNGTGNDTITLNGTKTVITYNDEGKEVEAVPEDGLYTFVLVSTGADFAVPDGDSTTIASRATSTDGEFSFELEYLPEDAGKTFYYVVREENGGSIIDHVFHDATEYHITVEVKENGSGGIEAVPAIVRQDGTAAQSLDFVNNEVQLELTYSAVKYLRGGIALKGGDFTFALYRTDENFTVAGEPLATATNDAKGNISFDAIDVAQYGTERQYFVILEKSDNPIDGITYDTTRYHITCQPLKVVNGRLTVDLEDATIYRVRNGVSVEIDSSEGIVFENFGPSTTPTTTPDTPETNATQPSTPSRPSTTPDTGDDANLLVWFALLFVSAAGVIFVVIFGRKKEKA